MRRTESERQQAMLLRTQGLTFAEISQRLDIPIGTISSWARQSGVTPEGPPPADVSGDAPAAAVLLEPPDEPSQETRRDERPPQPPPGARTVAPEQLDYRLIEDYISGFYKLGAQLAGQTDAALQAAIYEHADEAGSAWASWIRSEPKVAALLQRMMIGTPIGRVIGVHISIVIGYVLARGAQRDAERRLANAAEGPRPADEPDVATPHAA